MSLTFTAYITVGSDESYSLGHLGTNGLIKRLLVPFADEPETEPCGSDDDTMDSHDLKWIHGIVPVSTAVMWVLERLAEDPNESSIDFKNTVMNVRRAFDSPNVEAYISYS